MADAKQASDLYVGTKDVDERFRFDEARLTDYLNEHVDGFCGPMTVSQFKGGQSNPTYKIETPNAAYVLRRKPPGELLPSAHAVDREYRVISALHATGFPVPKTYALCEDVDIVGTMFFVMECVDGRVFWNGTLPDQTKAFRTGVYEGMADTLSQLHQIDYKAAGLEDFGRPGNYFARQINRWSKQYRASATQDVAAMDKLMDWLPGNIPSDDSVSLVHGDISMTNMMFHPVDPRVVAVLDWEISTVGHPLGDLTYNMLSWYAPPVPGATTSLRDIDHKGLGIPTEEEYVRWYCERTGRDGIENMAYYKAYNLFRLAAILQGILGRVRDGTASNANASDMAARVAPLANTGWEFALQAGAV
ncbi:MAG: phosphotransferase family protein [Gammaproteobacteria bacterium]|nr:phosphotransferase family protein [Gammaproteobacteria bacterium]